MWKGLCLRIWKKHLYLINFSLFIWLPYINEFRFELIFNSSTFSIQMTITLCEEWTWATFTISLSDFNFANSNSIPALHDENVGGVLRNILLVSSWNVGKRTQWLSSRPQSAQTQTSKGWISRDYSIIELQHFYLGCSGLKNSCDSPAIIKEDVIRHHTCRKSPP